MKTFLALAFTFSITSVFAQDCNPQGKKLSEKMIRDSVEKEFGSSYSINFYTDSDITTEYTPTPECISETLYVLEALDSKSGQTKTYMGKLVIDPKGNKQADPVLVQASL